MKRERRKKVMEVEATELPKQRIKRSRTQKSSFSIRKIPMAEKQVLKAFETRSAVPKKTRVKWKPDFLRIIYHMALLGAKEEEIATALGVKRNAISVWKRSRPGVREALRDGKMIADAKMAESFYQAGVGYSHPETKLIPNRVKTFNDKGKIIKDELVIERVEVIKHYPPNVTAGVKWLKARHPELWGEKANDTNAQIININTLNFADFSNAELEMLTKMGFKQKGMDIPALSKGDSSFDEFEEITEEEEITE